MQAGRPVPLLRVWPAWRKYLSRLLPVWRALGSSAIVCLAAFTAFSVHLNLAAAGFIQLFIVLVVALRSGFLQATLASLIAYACLNFLFVPPVFSFTIADPQNWIALAVFECSALLVSRLSHRAQEQTRRAQQHEHELESLYQVSRQLLLLNNLDGTGLQVLSSLQRVFSVEAAVLFDAGNGKCEMLGAEALALRASTKSAYRFHQERSNPDDGIWLRVLQVGGQSIGALGLRSRTLTAPVVNALASLTAIALERARLFESHSQAEAENKTEQLRTVVLDALAHEYKTPLTVVRTATSGLLQIGSLLPVQAELVGLIDREAVRLSEITTKLLQMSRLDKADVRLRRDRIDLQQFLEDLAAGATRYLSGHVLRVEPISANTSLLGDHELLAAALTQFLDNAAKYSDIGSPITLTASVTMGELQVSVHNVGPQIPPEDQDRLFQRFFRGASDSYRAPGTGLGLWIARRIALMHGGRVWVESSLARGNRFIFAIPLNGKSNE